MEINKEKDESRLSFWHMRMN